MACLGGLSHDCILALDLAMGLEIFFINTNISPLHGKQSYMLIDTLPVQMTASLIT